METVNVELGERSYPIYIGAGCLRELGAKLAESGSGRRVAVVTNSTVAALYLDQVRATLADARFDPVAIQIPDGEEHKNLAWLAFLYDKLIDGGVDRNGALIALGGGVVGDLAGFAAATYLRGIRCVQIPTTLLAQVDSSIGGKTGINHAAGKNLIGAFAQPRFVLADVDTLKSLPRRELTAGLAEVIKYGVILDADFFDLVEERLPAVQHHDRALMIELVRRSCELKARVVSEDEHEGDFRAVLNFGHTLGHAIESLTEYKQFLHGEAVSIGMVAAARLSAKLGLCKDSDHQRIRRLLDRCGLPTEIPPDMRGEPLALAMRTDKKAASGTIKFVCIERIGKTRFERLTCEEIARHI